MYLTGDTHGNLDRIATFCEENHLKNDDVVIVLGDAGLNYYTDSRSFKSKAHYSKAIGCELLCIHGNHEQNPEHMGSMKEKEWKGGVVFYEEDFPRILYAKDGEVYDLDGKKAIALGGAYSIDKDYRLMMGWNWFSDEQMSPEVMERCEKKLGEVGWSVDYVLSHTVPLSAEPVEFFLKGIDQSKVDKTMEVWLEKIKNHLHFERWYAGHYHCEVEKQGNIEILFNTIKGIGDYEKEKATNNIER